MAKHNDVGKKGEDLAVEWLEEHDYTVIRRNFKFIKNEVDIIALRDEVVHFVEVKCRQSMEHPECNVNRKKFREIAKAADHFLYKHPWFHKIRFDIMAINLVDPEPIYFFIEDVYF
jgi:putative endonuclease